MSRLGWLAASVATASIIGCVTGGGPTPVPVTRQAWSEEGLCGRRLATEHFEIISTLHDMEFENALPAFLEAAYKRYEETIPSSNKVETKLTTYIFNTRSEWAQFMRRHFPVRYNLYARIRSGGFSEGDKSASFHVSRSTTLAVLAHEGWHQYIASRFDAPIPAWLNEGLACYHEALEFAGPAPRFTPQHNTFRINSLRKAVHEDKIMSLREIVDTDAGQIIGRCDSDTTQVYYAQAWALVTFLRHGAGGRREAAFERMLRDIVDGTFPVHVSAMRLRAGDGATMSIGEATLTAYFNSSPNEMSGEYYDHLVSLVGF